MLSCTEGLTVDMDKYSYAEGIGEKEEQLLISTGFLDRNTTPAFACLSELLVTPNFDEPANIQDLLKQTAIHLANNMGAKGMQYAKSYSSAGLKAHAEGYEALSGDVFFCEFDKHV